MVRKTRHAPKHKKQAYRHKTQKGGFTPALISSISQQISSRLGPMLGHFLERAQVSGSAQYATQAIAETGSVAAEALASALRQVVNQAISKTPALASSAEAITNEILTSAAARISQSSSLTAGAAAAPAAAALTAAAGAALATSAAAAGSVLFSMLQSTARNPEQARTLVTALRESVLPAIKRQIDRFLQRGTDNPVLEITAGLPKRAPPPRTLLLGPAFSRGAYAGRVIPGSRRFAEAVVRQGMASKRYISTEAGNTADAAARSRADAAARSRANAVAQNQAAAAKASNANNTNPSVPDNAPPGAAPPSTKSIFTDAQIDAMPRRQLERIFKDWKPVGQSGPLPIPAGIKGTQEMKDFIKSTIMPALKKEYKNKTGRNTPPPPTKSSVPARTTITNLVAQAAKSQNVAAGGGAAQNAQIDTGLHTSTNQVANQYDVMFTPSPLFVELLTNSEKMREAAAAIPDAPDNAVGLLSDVLRDSVIGKAVQSVQITKGNASYYKQFGRLSINIGHVAKYNEEVEKSMRILLQKASRDEVQTLLSSLTGPRMQAFRVGFLDLFLSSPAEANRVLQTMVGQILPYNKLTPVAFDSIITTLQQNPENISVVLERIVGQRATAEQEVSFATRLWRSRGAGQTTGRYGIIGLGVISILFLCAHFDISNFNEAIFHLNRELSTLGLSDVLANGINSLDRFYDALHFVVLGRNAENAVSAGLIAPAASSVQAVRNWWSGFIQAGHPPTLFQALISNLNTILDRVGRQNAVVFAGASVIGLLIYRGRQLAIDQERAAAAPPPATNGGPPPPPPPRGGPAGNGDPPFPPSAPRPRENFNIASLPPKSVVAARTPLPPNNPNNNG